ncbi:MAG: nucleotidyl transferase AbiEii/AbiGii toxin family protein [Candidatus Auribacterota bacterium]
MLHKNRDEFLKILERTSAQTGFPLRLVEKDYYLTIIISRINDFLSDNLVFKGGTCLNKIYYEYYRLSEDLDFTLILPSGTSTRTSRRKAISPIKESIVNFAKSLDMKIDNPDRAVHNESNQYIYYLSYKSVVIDKREPIKLEIGLRFNPILQPVEMKIHHRFIHPFTGEPLFDAGSVKCLDLKELVAEKMRAASTRLVIAPRDFYDLGYLIRKGFDFEDKALLKIFQEKLGEDGYTSDLKKYHTNLGRTEDEIKAMKSRLEYELFPVLTEAEQRQFDVDKVFEFFSRILK